MVVLVFLIIFSEGFLSNLYSIKDDVESVPILAVFNQFAMMILCSWLFLIIWFPQRGALKNDG